MKPENILWIVHAPESDGRPEKTIADRILSYLKKYRPDINYRSIRLEHGEDPLAGKLFYDNETFMQTFMHAIRQLSHPKDGLHDGDRILFIEGFNPMIQVLDYWLYCEGKNVKKAGIFHSNCYTDGDLFEGSDKMLAVEGYLLEHGLDRVLVATEYLRRNVAGVANSKFWGCDDESERQDQLKSKIRRVGLPVPDPRAMPLPKRWSDRYKTVVFSHRWADDKNKNFFVKLAEAAKLHPVMKDYKFKIFTPQPLDSAENLLATLKGVEVVVNSNKAEYHRRLNESRFVFSCAILETFGYSALEGVMCGCLPLLPDNTCYGEQYHPEFLYDADMKAVAFDEDYAEEVVQLVLDKLGGLHQKYDQLGVTVPNPMTENLLSLFRHDTCAEANIIKTVLEM